jgi:pSer/pThr/pTyr-binding forkhead associated (FHA) protein
MENGQITPDGFIPLRLALGVGGMSVTLTRPDMLLGRHSDADIKLPLPDVSRRHCRFIWTEGEWRVHDLQSTNGVFVNEDRVTVSNLCHDDQIRIGSYVFTVQLERKTGKSQSVATTVVHEVFPERLAS